MAVRLTHVCDPCDDQGEEVEGSQRAISVGDLAGNLDLCEVHEKELVEPLRQLLLTHGRTDHGKPVRAGRRASPGTHSTEQVPCPVAGCERGPFANRGSMLAHLRNGHETTEAELLGEAGFVCEVRGCGRAFGSPQARSVHKARKHPPRQKRS